MKRKSKQIENLQVKPSITVVFGSVPAVNKEDSEKFHYLLRHQKDVFYVNNI